MSETLSSVNVLTFLHDLFTVVWVGGMIALALGMLPALRRSVGIGPQMQATVNAFQRRYRWVVLVCIVGLAWTGVFLSRRSPEFHAWFSWDDTYSMVLSLKHVLVIVMVLIVALRLVLTGREKPRQGASPSGGAGARHDVPVNRGTGPREGVPVGEGADRSEGTPVSGGAAVPESALGRGGSPSRPSAAAPQPSRAARAAMALLFVNAALGIVVLFLSAATATLSAG